VVLGRKDGGQLKVLLTADDLATCSSDHSKFLELLRTKTAEKGVPLNERTASIVS
jgi:5S rRNA maturation endonuclease (ribonuclease M5)